TKEGKPLSTTLVEITRGDRKVVAVRQEQRAAPAVHAVIGVPQLLRPLADDVLPNGTKGVTVPYAWEFAWSDVAGADSYQLRLQSASAPMPMFDEMIRSTKRLIEFPGYIPINEEWHWQVRARSGESWGAWSDKRVFHVAPFGERPVLGVQDSSIPLP